MREKRNVARNQKDTVFRLLFKDKNKLLELYNALNGTDHRDPDQLEIYTLENAIYMAMKNDLSMILDSELNLYEHQGSFNPNMPLRDLSYISRQLEKYVQAYRKDLYSHRLIKIPVPRFVVFYNGTEEQPERRILKLSDSFEKRVEDPELELKVLMLNINPGYNKELMKNCQTLKEYCEYVACVRAFARKEGIKDAVEHAVTECIQKGILSEFLKEQRAEVVAMSIFEYNEEETMRRIREDEFEHGREDGKAEGKAEDILELLADLGEIPKELREQIVGEHNLDTLKKWLKLAARAESLEEFKEAIRFS